MFAEGKVNSLSFIKSKKDNINFKSKIPRTYKSQILYVSNNDKLSLINGINLSGFTSSSYTYLINFLSNWFCNWPVSNLKIMFFKVWISFYSFSSLE